MAVRTIHFKGDGPVIHFGKSEWRPSGPTEMKTGEHVLVDWNSTGGLAVKRPGRRNMAPTETWTRKAPA